MHIVIGVPHTGIWKADFGTCLAEMCIWSATRGEKELSVAPFPGSLLGNQRTAIVKEAKRRKADYLLCLDSDMTFAPDTLEVLLSRNVDIVGANYVMKMIPAQPLARKWKNDEWALVYTYKASHGLEQVQRMGFGVCLIAMKVFEAIPQPWFHMPFLSDEEGHGGEDWWFCEQAEKAGFDIWLDHDVSHKVGHVGDVTYKHVHVRPEMIKRAPGKHYRSFSDRK